MKLYPFWLRCLIASAASDMRGLAVVAAAIAGLAYTGGFSGRTVLAVALTAGIVAGLHRIPRLRRTRSSPDDSTLRSGGPSAGDSSSPTVDVRFAAAGGPRVPQQPRLTPRPPARALMQQDGVDYSGAFGPSWQPSSSVAGGAPGGVVWVRRLGADLRVVLENEVATRRLLAREVHRVPEEWLDEVMRVRMSDLER